jgi:hypothetical protein
MRDVIRRIHPDLFANESDQIQAANLDCIQNIQEIATTITDLCTQLDDTSQNSIFLKSPLRDSYALRCYTRVGSEDAILMSSVSFITPPLLTRKVVLHRTEIKLPLATFLRHFSELWEKLEIDFPWESMMLKDAQSKNAFTHSHDENPNELAGLVDIVGAHLFDMSVAERHRRKGGRHHGVFGQLAGKSSRKSSRKHLELSVDRYLSSGQFLFQNVHVTDELACLVRMRTFLIDFGDLVNFTESNWRTVFVVMDGKTTASKDYEVETNGSNFVVRIPSKFKSVQLLTLLQDEVTVCKLM